LHDWLTLGTIALRGLYLVCPLYEGALLTLSNRRTGDLSPLGMLVDEGFEDGGDLPLLRAREP